MTQFVFVFAVACILALSQDFYDEETEGLEYKPEAQDVCVCPPPINCPKQSIIKDVEDEEDSENDT
jgi:hypothetical protein